MKFQHIGILAVVVASSAISASAFASAITWGLATNVAADSDVVTQGSLVSAVNFGTPSGATVNGVAFAGGPQTGLSSSGAMNNYTAWTTAGGLSPSYVSLLDSGVYTNADTPPTLTLTLNSLILGAGYKVEVWSNDHGSFRTENVTDGIGNSVSLSNNPAQYVVGTFTADATLSQVVVFQDGAIVNQVNAYELRLVTPEPASLVLLGLGALGLLFAARRRRMA